MKSFESSKNTGPSDPVKEYSALPEIIDAVSNLIHLVSKYQEALARINDLELERLERLAFGTFYSQGEVSALQDRIRELEAQLAAPVAVKVKPLVWENVNEDGCIQIAVGFNSVYRVWLSADKIARWQAAYMDEWFVASGPLDAAKSAAQAHHEARVLASIDLVSKTEVRLSDYLASAALKGGAA
jgi:hypothetical protein